MTDGEPSWIDGGYGKLRYGGGKDGDLRLAPRLAEADLVWQPHFTWSLGATVVAIAQHGQEHPIDLSEASLSFKPMLPGSAKLTVRAGVYWPAISLEHSGPEWAVTDTITPSAINSWIGEEIKTGGIEATVTAPLGAHRVAATFGAFGLNDTSGTLLAFRGWALHDQKATLFGQRPLPPRSAFMQEHQAPETRPVIELDNRVGWYGKLGWSPAEAFELQYFHYDNRGNPEAVTNSGQWGWRTHFDNLGAIVSLGRTQIKAQAMQGCTEMGYPMPDRIWVDTHFRSAFVLATRNVHGGSVSARVEAFGTHNSGSAVDARSSESGWGVTAAVRHALTSRLTLLGELLHVDSRREQRRDLGLQPRQRQNQAQIALRLRL